MRLRFATFVLALGALGCVGNFDPALIPGGGVIPLSLGDYCTDGASIPELARRTPDDPSQPVTISYAIDTAGLASDVNEEVSSCTGDPQPGNDGFLRIHMNGSERWHFHIRHPSNAMSPSIYVLASACDARTCSEGAGLDLCGASADEHFTFVADRTADYFVGIDGDGLGMDGEGGFAAQLDVIHPVCGNGIAEHSEGCDLGPDVEGDACDPDCRRLIRHQDAEVEANDDTFAANHIVIEGETTSIDGRLSTACENDMFTFTVPDEGPMDAALSLALQDGGCPGAAAVPLSIDLFRDGASSSVASAEADGVTCPSVTAPGLIAGQRYFIRLRSVEGVARDVRYRLTLDLTTP